MSHKTQKKGTAEMPSLFSCPVVYASQSLESVGGRKLDQLKRVRRIIGHNF